MPGESEGIMKLDASNAKFAVIRMAFHGGGTIAFSNSLERAMRIERENTASDCCCGCCAVVPVTEEAMEEMNKYRNKYGEYVFSCDTLYDEYPAYTANGEHYAKLCR